jgi:hypothetical protein
LAFFTCDSRSRERIHFSCTLGRAAPASREPPRTLCPGMVGTSVVCLGVVLFPPLPVCPPGANSGN